MSDFLKLTHQTQQILAESADMAKQFGYETASQTILRQLDVCRKKELMIVAAGEAKRGKSSMLNAILNEKDPLFPVDINLCTNVVTIVRYGKQESVEAYIEDPKAENGCRVEKLRREQISDYVSEKGNPNNYRKVKVLNIRVPNELLKEGVVFVDTPGVGSLNIEHAETTYSFLPHADVLLFVSDADSGLTQSELKFLKRGYTYCKNILFPLTKKDLNENYNTILEDNRKKISKTLEIPAETVQIIPVSSRAKLQYLKSGRKTMLINSNYPAFEEAIWSMVSRCRGEALLLPFLAAARDEMLGLADNIVAQYQMLDADQNTVNGLMNGLNVKVDELDKLQNAGADWRNELALFFTKLQNDLSGRQQKIAADARDLVESRSNVLGDKICDEKNYSKLVCDVNALISSGVMDIQHTMASEVDQMAVKLQKNLAFCVNVNQNILNNMGYTPKGNLAVTFPKKKTLDAAINFGRKVSMSSVGGGKTGAIIGGFVGFCFGGPAGMVLGIKAGAGVGGLVGGAKGCVDALTKHDQLDINAVKHALAQHISNAMIGINTGTGNAIAGLRITVNASFEQQLKSQTKNLQENITQMQKNISTATSEIPKKRGILESQNAELKKKLGQYDALEKAIVGFSQDAPVKRQDVSVKGQDAPVKRQDVSVKGQPVRRDEAKNDTEKVTYAFL